MKILLTTNKFQYKSNYQNTNSISNSASKVNFQGIIVSPSSIRAELQKLYARKAKLQELINNATTAGMKAIYESLLKACESKIEKLEKKLYYLTRE